MIRRFFSWRNLSVKPVLFLSQGQPRGFHALVPLKRRFVRRALSELSAIARVLSEVIRLFQGVLLSGEDIRGAMLLSTMQG